MLVMGLGVAVDIAVITVAMDPVHGDKDRSFK